MKSLRRLWFELQVSKKVDLFDEGFQLACLIEILLTVMNNTRKIIKKRLDQAQMYFCLDEAQADIDAQIRTVDGTVPLFRLWARNLSAFNYSTLPLRSPLIYSGTSLSTKEAVEAVKYGGYNRQSDEDGSSHTSDCQVF